MSPCCCNKLPGTWGLQTVFTFVLFCVHRSEVLYGSHWAKIKGVGRAVFLLEILGENPLPCLFQLLEATDIPGERPSPPSSKPAASYFSPSNSCFQFSTRAFRLHTFVRTYRVRHRVNPQVSCELGMVLMCLCRFISCNKCTIWWEMLMAEEAVDIWEKEVYRIYLGLLLSICCEP